MLFYLLASLHSVSLDPHQNPSGGALAQRLGALISWSVALLWLGSLLRLRVVRLIISVIVLLSRIIVFISCIIVFISCIVVFLLVVVVAISVPILVKNWLQSGELAFFATKMRHHSSVGRLDRLLKLGELLCRRVGPFPALRSYRSCVLSDWRRGGCCSIGGWCSCCLLRGDCSDGVFSLRTFL